jgi:hypothetical protein
MVGIIVLNHPVLTLIGFVPAKQGLPFGKSVLSELHLHDVTTL